MKTRLATFAVLLSLGVSAVADIIHVHPDSTYSTIQSGIDAADKGDTVLVHPATYNENIELVSNISVYSSHGPDTTIIGGASSWTRTVYVSGKSDVFFSGFTIEGDEGYGMYAASSVLDVNNIVFDCDPDTAILYDYYGYSTYDSITIEGLSEAKSGLHAKGSWADYTNIVVRNLQNRGIYVSNGHGPDFSDITIDSCGTGIYIQDSGPSFNGGDLSNCTTGVEAFVPEQNFSTTRITAMNLDVSDCGTGFSTSAESEDDIVIVSIDTCTVTDCHDGMILDRPSGHVKYTDFDDIGDIGITITEGERIIIGARADSNTFTDVGGVGILADSGAVVTIGKNEFTDVLGTAIEIETQNDSSFVSYCDMDGSGGCYEGIATSGDGTMATIRWCDIYDYDRPLSPVPRGVTVLRATAHLGEGVSDQGKNNFETNAIDLSYQTKAGTPDTLKAEYNWWGEDPPDTSDFSGRKAYIDYDPWLTEESRFLPVSEEPSEVPMVTRLTNVCPNPGAGSVKLMFWIPEDGNLELSVYNLDGRRVRTLYKGEMTAGPGSVVWDGCDGAMTSCPSGVYLIRLNSRSGTDTGRFVLVR